MDPVTGPTKGTVERGARAVRKRPREFARPEGTMPPGTKASGTTRGRDSAMSSPCVNAKRVHVLSSWPFSNLPRSAGPLRFRSTASASRISIEEGSTRFSRGSTASAIALGLIKAVPRSDEHRYGRLKSEARPGERDNEQMELLA